MVYRDFIERLKTKAVLSLTYKKFKCITKDRRPGKGTLKNTITVKEVDAEFLKPVSADRFELLGVKLKDVPVLPDLRLKFDEEVRRATISLVIPGATSEQEKEITFDLPLPLRLIPDATMSIKDIMEEGCDAEALIENAMAVLVKRIVRIRIEPRVPMEIQDDLEVTMIISNFESQAVCPLSDFAGFIHQEEFETAAEWDARHAPVEK